MRPNKEQNLRAKREKRKRKRRLLPERHLEIFWKMSVLEKEFLSQIFSSKTTHERSLHKINFTYTNPKCLFKLPKFSKIDFGKENFDYFGLAFLCNGKKAYGSTIGNSTLVVSMVL